MRPIVRRTRKGGYRFTGDGRLERGGGRADVQGNAPQGVVRFSAKIFANGREANVYRTHKELWSYHFHGPLPRTFDVKGSRKKHTMKRGGNVSLEFCP